MKKIAPFLVILAMFFVSAVPAARGETYRVRKGDTLWKIAARYKTSVRKIERENRFLRSSHRLKPGEKLRIASRRLRRIRHIRRRRLVRLYRHRLERRRRIRHLRRFFPYARRHRELAHDADSHGPVQSKTVALPSGPVIRASEQAGLGETDPCAPDKTDLIAVSRISDVPGLKTIASSRYGADAGLSNAIRAAIVNSMVLESARGKENGEAVVFNAHHAKKIKAKIYHRIKEGESLYSIARRNGITVARLKRLNYIRSGRTLLKPGKRLVVGIRVAHAESRISRVFYTVRPGDNFYRIAAKFHVRPERLEDLNEIEPTDLRPGMKIRLGEAGSVIPPKSVMRIKVQLKELRDSKAVASLSVRDRLLLFAKAMLNVPYRFGGASFYGIDCSAFVQKVYNLLGVSLPRTAQEQYREGVPVSLADLAVGDLLFFRTYASFPSHVGIYIGKDLIVYASSGRCKVRVGRLSTPYFMRRLIGAKRILFDQELPAAGN